MVENRRHSDRTWYWWTALVLALGAAILAFGCGTGRDGAEDTVERGRPVADAGAVSADMGAAGDAAWLEALDGLALAVPAWEGRGDDAGTLSAVGDSGIVDGDEGGAVAMTPTETPIVVTTPYDSSRVLSDAETRQVLTAAGWPVELHDQAMRVIDCESSFSPAATNGISWGLFQLVPLWFSYAGESFELWYDEYVNARVAWAAYQYDIGRGQAQWAQWQCKP